MDNEQLEKALNICIEKLNTVGMTIKEFDETDKRLVYILELNTNPKTWGDAQNEQNYLLELLEIVLPNIEYILREIHYGRTIKSDLLRFLIKRK